MLSATPTTDPAAPMRHVYRHLDPSLIQALLAGLELDRLVERLLLAAAGDVEQVREWLEQLQQQGFLPPGLDLDALLERLERRGLLGRDGEGQLQLAPAGEKRLRQSAFRELFAGLRKAGGELGNHAVRAAGEGVEKLPETRAWRFGDDFQHLDAVRSLHNALQRTNGRLELAEEDLEVYETEHLTSCATVVAIDISHSMVLYGEDRITPARTLALALTELIDRSFPHDRVEVLVFGDRAKRIARADLTRIDAGPYHTNTAEALQLARGILSRCRQPNRQVLLITDGKPSAITKGGGVYKNPFGLDLEIVNRTLEEADQCRRQRILVTTFMLATDPWLQDFVEQLTRTARGRAFFSSPERLGEFVLADYLQHRRRLVR